MSTSSVTITAPPACGPSRATRIGTPRKPELDSTAISPPKEESSQPSPRRRLVAVAMASTSRPATSQNVTKTGSSRVATGVCAASWKSIAVSAK